VERLLIDPYLVTSAPTQIRKFKCLLFLFLDLSSLTVVQRETNAIPSDSVVTAPKAFAEDWASAFRQA
jgi:hypothetical protein